MRRRDQFHYNCNLKKFNEIKNSNVNKEIILKWLNKRNKTAVRQGKGFSNATKGNYLFLHRIIVTKVLTKSLKEYKTKKEIEELIDSIDSLKYSIRTKFNIKLELKNLFKSLGKNKIVDWIKVKRIINKPKREELLTEEEVINMINLTQNDRDRAFLITLYESGGRIGEIGTLTYEDVNIKEKSVNIRVNGKTGERVIPLVQSKPYLVTWINKHPTKDPKDPLWIYDLRQGKKLPSYTTFHKIINMAKKRAGIEKRCNPHAFRKSRASILAPELKESVLNQYMGWVQGSNMPQVYINVDNRIVEDKILELHGVKKKKSIAKDSILTPRKCPNAKCNLTNEASNTHCSDCGTALTIEEFVKQEESNKGKVDKINLIFNTLKEKGFLK